MTEPKIIILDGSDWEADYFLSEAQCNAWRNRSRNLHNMLRSDAGRAGFVQGEPAPWALTGTVPGCDRTFLLENGQCEDPYYARNLEHTAYCENYSWAFRKRFTVPESWRGSRVCIDFKGMDYQATLFLNGAWFGKCKGQFVPVHYDITELVKFGEENLVVAVFEPAPQGTPNHQDHDPADFAKYHRTQIGFGWDWSRGIVPTGIWDSVSVSAYSEVLIEDWHFVYDGETARVELDVDSRFGGAAEFALELLPFNFSGSGSSAGHLVQCVPGHNHFVLEIPVPRNVQKWYPVGMGFPALYTLNISCGDQLRSAQVGFRQISMSRNPDSPAGAYDLTFNINGKPLFARGANYVPADLLNSRASNADYEHLVREAANAGMNIFRVWGGGVIEKDGFFAACDRYGVMVWQEFMHACSNAPKDEEFLAFKEVEARAILRKIRNHVSLALICGGNEMQYYGEIPNSPMLKNYQRIAAELTPELPFHTSCPDLSRPGERNHGPWNHMEHRFWNTHFRYLASEVGCNAMPEYDSLCRFIPEREIEVLNGPALEYHFYNRVNVYDLGKPLTVFNVQGAREFCAASMFAQSDALQYTMEHYRRLYPKASGCFFWQYNEPWPTCTFSIIDYYGVPKMALYGMKRANAPVLLSLEDDSWCCKDHQLNAKWFITCDHAFAGTAALKAVAADGTGLFTRECDGSWETGTVQLGEISEKLPEGITAVFFYLNGEYAGVRVFGAPDFKKAFGIPAEVSGEIAGDKIIIRNTGKTLALHVRIDFPGTDPKSYTLSDNYLVLAPGEIREIGYTGKLDDKEMVISQW